MRRGQSHVSSLPLALRAALLELPFFGCGRRAAGLAQLELVAVDLRLLHCGIDGHGGQLLVQGVDRVHCSQRGVFQL